MKRERSLSEYVLRREWIVQQALEMHFSFDLHCGKDNKMLFSTKQMTNWEDTLENFRVKGYLDDGDNKMSTFMEFNTDRIVSK